MPWDIADMDMGYGKKFLAYFFFAVHLFNKLPLFLRRGGNWGVSVLKSVILKSHNRR